jgi:hypothetical protein
MENDITDSKTEDTKLSRREALLKLGKFGAYSAPVVMGVVSMQALGHSQTAVYSSLADCVADSPSHANPPSGTNPHCPNQANHTWPGKQ